ncbi:PLP-dependent aminotransferase family protein [Winogradskya humida]|uniref:GntR family transcriptional regulator n=1 Tax=Winogradskya humida TaxID=113566 RepID=A0ABQ3ZK90_9ACTN|nr:PLP-dependent aminotransferase family protein [Actinoplanes humidus]GIE18927.1 GntR family transcriptional regulator [Actinoplanes humidus]
MDFLGVPPARDRTAWLVEALRAAIADGRLADGSRLPATRVLAQELGLSRGVVVEAYQRLTDEGLLSGRTGAGTRVTAPAPHAWHGPDRAEPPGLRLPLPPVRGLELDLSPGLPDLSAFPRAAWLRAERTVLGETTGADLGYGDPRGNPRLRSELATWLGRHRGVRATADDILVVSGVAQAIALLCRVLCARGIEAWGMEDPGSRGARDQLVHWGVQPVAIPVDGHGLRVAELAATELRAVLLTPAHQFPTGVVLSPRRRLALLEWSGLIVEDDYDAEHRYDRPPVAALQASAPDRVAYCGSVSKSLAPGMRLGWLVAPRELQAELVAAKHGSDLGNPALAQLVLARLLATGEHDRHLRTVRRRQRRHRDALVAALREYVPAARVEGVAAGLHVLVTLPGDADDAELAARIGALGVRVQPLSWHRQRPGPPGLVLGYAAQPPDRLLEAVRRIGRILGGWTPA